MIAKDAVKKLSLEYFISESQVRYILMLERKRHGINYVRGRQPHPGRDAKIVELVDFGMSFEDVAEKYEIGIDRTRQIYYTTRKKINEGLPVI